MHIPWTLRDLLEINAKRFPTKPAFSMDDRQITHKELLAQGKRLASALYKAGVHKQDRISILSMNSLEYAEVLAACQWSGIIAATVNFRLAAPEMEYIINDSSPRVLIFEAQYLETIEQIKPSLKSVEKFICIGGKCDWADDYHDFIGGGDDCGPPFHAVEEDICALIYTSGTTGRPKGCILGQREMYLGAQTLSMEIMGSSSDCGLLVMPLFHIGAMAIGLCIHFRGGSVVLQREFDPGAFLAEIDTQPITVLHLAPTMVQMVLEHPNVSTTDLSRMRTIVYSAAPMPSPVLLKGMELMGNIFINLYGQTEAFTSGLPRELHLPEGNEYERQLLTSVGIPYPNTLVKIVDDDGVECPAGVAGEIVVKSESLFRGYWNNHKATIESIKDGWFHTGDMGKFDDHGILYLVDRKKDVIISGGENIYSREVEEALLQHRAVSECAVIGLADPKWGESVCAVVVLKKGEAVTEKELIEHSRTLIASYKKPKKVVFIDELPKLATGKINKVELRNLYKS